MIESMDFNKYATKNLFFFLRIVLFILVLVGTINSVYAQSPLCASAPTTFCCEYVSEVSINGVTRAGAPDATGFSSGPGYFDYTGSSIGGLVASNTYPVSVTVKTNNSYQEYVKIWFDFNGNGDLSDSGELVYDDVNTFNGTYVYSGNVTVPLTAFNGDIYIRVIMVFSAVPQLCGSYTYGTTMDLKASISGGVASQNLTVSTSGTGGYNGNITSSPSGINTSGGFNSANFADGTTVSLTAVPTGTAKFTGWSGDASGTDNPLSVTMNSAKNITANFGPPNTPPVANGDTYNRFYTDGGVSFTIPDPSVPGVSGVLGNDTDADGNSLTVGSPRPATAVTQGTLTLNANGSFTYTSPNSVKDQTATFTYYAYDGTVNSSTAATVTINIYTPRFIGGGGNNNFSNPANWNCGYVPTESLNIIIAAEQTMVINQNYTCKTLQFETGSSFNCTGGNTLTITGDVLDQNGNIKIDVASSLVVRSSIEILNTGSAPPPPTSPPSEN